jgi:D-lactate dehydrogenase (cytochrome)
MISAVHYPETEADVIETLHEASGSETFATVSGGRTGITGSRIPIHGGIIISMDKFLSPVIVSEDGHHATLPPGIQLAELDRALPVSLMYPPDPTEKSAFLGGTVATNASGARGFHYGSTRDWVEGLRVVLANGDVLTIKRDECHAENGILNFKTESGNNYSVAIPDYMMPNIKNAAGVYSKKNMDLIDLFIGSEGIFGIFTEVHVRLENRPDIMSDIVFFDNVDDALAHINEIRNLKDEGLFSLEFFDGNSLEFMRDEYPEINDGVSVAVFTESIKDDRLLSLISESAARNNACGDWCAMTSADVRKLKELRHALPDGINTYIREHESYKLGTDFVVSAVSFDEMFARYLDAGKVFKTRFKRAGMHYTLFGHIGDYHLHFNFFTQTDEERRAAKNIFMELVGKTVNLGGTISGEHGVGKKTVMKNGEQIPYLELMYGQEGLKEIARVKKVFDPKGILNIGNMIPREYLL